MDGKQQAFLPRSRHRNFSPSPPLALSRTRNRSTFWRPLIVGASNTNAHQESKSANFRTGSGGCHLMFLSVKFLPKTTTGGRLSREGRRGHEVPRGALRRRLPCRDAVIGLHAAGHSCQCIRQGQFPPHWSRVEIQSTTASSVSLEGKRWRQMVEYKGWILYRM